MKNDVMRRYGDIIRFPHHVSDTRPRMPMLDRAAQFSPFAALTGYEAVIRETERLTEDRAELDECGKAALDGKLRLLAEHLKERPEVTITFFRPDARKDGGAYVQAVGPVRKIDGYRRTVVMESGVTVPIEQIYGIAGELFRHEY